MRVGNRLWRVCYWTNPLIPHKRVIESKKITKINKKTVVLSWYRNYKIRKSEIDRKEWFTSEIKALENKLLLHEDALLQENQDYDLIKKEIKTLSRMIERRKKKQVVNE